MSRFKENVIREKTLNELWANSVWLTVENGYFYRVETGSYEGQLRLQLPYYVGIAETPGKRPLFPVMNPCIPAPTTDDKIAEYFLRYLVSIKNSENEDYTYGQFIFPQLNRLIDLLNRSKGATNQATINVGDIFSVQLNDPPCLRALSFKVVGGQLNLTVYFRSWDLIAGMPENLGGLQLLKEYILSYLTFDVADGSIIAFSDGLHVYEQYFGMVENICVTKGRIREVQRE